MVAGTYRLAAPLAFVIATILATGCAFARPSVDPALAVAGDGIGPLYPGGEMRCDPERCDEILAEIASWVEMNAAGHGPTQAVSFHGAVDIDGQQIVLTRSGGGVTYIAVVVFEDGSRTALLVGCGAGLDPDWCFASP